MIAYQNWIWVIMLVLFLSIVLFKDQAKIDEDIFLHMVILHSQAQVSLEHQGWGNDEQGMTVFLLNPKTAVYSNISTRKSWQRISHAIHIWSILYTRLSKVYMLIVNSNYIEHWCTHLYLIMLGQIQCRPCLEKSPFHTNFKIPGQLKSMCPDWHISSVR